jgi:hypothetical protein
MSGSTQVVQQLTREMQAELTTVGSKLTQAGMKPRVERDHLELLPGTPDVMIIRVMEDGDYSRRAHLRSVVGDAEVTVSTEKLRNLHKLISRAQIMMDAVKRTHDTDGVELKKR